MSTGNDKGADAGSPYLGRLPSLDGWRAIFISIVLNSHFGRLDLPYAFHFLIDGELGVRCFFVLSGLLITYLLLVEAGQFETVSIVRFYQRRALRIVPVYLCFLAVIFAEQVQGSLAIPVSSWIGLLTFTANFCLNLEDWFVFHLWSLSIEQQFYLVWPALFVVLRPWKSPRPILWVLLAVICLIVPYRLAAGAINFWYTSAQFGQLAANSQAWALLAFAKDHFSWAFRASATFHFLDCLAIGCACAALLYHFPAFFRNMSTSVTAFLFVVSISFVIVPAGLATDIRWLRGALYLFGNSVQAVGCGILLIMAICKPKFLPYRMLNTRALVFVGMISYSMYIWQQPFMHLWLSARSAMAKLCAVVVVAWLSYWIIEKPFNAVRIANAQSYRPTI